MSMISESASVRAASAYIPQPGTIPARALAWFDDQPPNAEVTTGVLAEALGQPMASIITSLETAVQKGMLRREKRDGRLFWRRGTAIEPMLGYHGALPVSGDVDDADDDPIVQRVVSAPAAPKNERAASTGTPPPKSKKPRGKAPTFDPLTIAVVSNRALPVIVPKAKTASPYKALLERLSPGDSVDMHPIAAKSLLSAAKKLGVKVAARKLSDEITGVWRL